MEEQLLIGILKRTTHWTSKNDDSIECYFHYVLGFLYLCLELLFSTFMFYFGLLCVVTSRHFDVLDYVLLFYPYRL